MRVVAGIAGGRRLRVPAAPAIRPTTDRVREALFAALGSLDAVEGARVLDLYAGTGALGIEALSRGAASATFVDEDARAVAAIRANLAAVGLEGTVVRDDALRFLGRAPGPFDLVFADPPYAFAEWPALFGAVPSGLVAAESGAEIAVPGGWESVRVRRYGDTVVTLARRS